MSWKANGNKTYKKALELTPQLRDPEFWGKKQESPNKQKVLEVLSTNNLLINYIGGKKKERKNLHFPESDIAVAERGTDNSNADFMRHWRRHQDLF